MKKILLLFAMMVITVTANAQFEQGKIYFGASMSSLDFNYSKYDKLTFNGSVTAGYFVVDDIMAFAEIGTSLNSGDYSAPNEFTLGLGGRYYIIQNGIYLGASAQYTHIAPQYNDVKPQVEVGYAFFLNRTITVEPALYYNHSFKNMDYSKIGIKVTFGLNFEANKKGKSIFNM